MVRLGLLWTISDLLVVAAGLARVERRCPLSRELWRSSGAFYREISSTNPGFLVHFIKYYGKFRRLSSSRLDSARSEVQEIFDVDKNHIFCAFLIFLHFW